MRLIFKYKGDVLDIFVKLNKAVSSGELLCADDAASSFLLSSYFFQLRSSSLELLLLE